MEKKPSYSQFLGIRSRQRDKPALTFQEVMASTPSSTTPPNPSHKDNLMPDPAPPPDLTPIWNEALEISMKLDQKKFEESRARFYRDHPNVPPGDSYHPLVPNMHMVRQFMIASNFPLIE